MIANLLSYNLSKKQFKIIDFTLIILFAVIPLFTSFNYRINIFLSWEGAYRMSLGQIPFRDFGLPLGAGYWLVPALFFKIFGPQFISLIKAQVLLNIVSGMAFRQILKNFKVDDAALSISVFIFSISFTFINPWPWYNHTVIVYQFVGLALLSATYTFTNNLKTTVCAFLAAFFLVLSFFTKQDAGALGIMIALIVTIVYSFYTKKWLNSAIFFLSILVIGIITVALLNISFLYWFNHGQAPHASRLSIFDILDEFFIASEWIKFYIIFIALFILYNVQKKKTFEFMDILFALFTLGILVEAAIFQVTSYVPKDNNIFFHSFAAALILNYLAKEHIFKLEKIYVFIIFGVCVLLFWSVNYWNQVNRVIANLRPKTSNISPTGENVVNKSNFMIDCFTQGTVPTWEWQTSNWYSLKKIKMPVSTIDGIDRLKNNAATQNLKNKKVLNMSELTFLAHDLDFQLEKGASYPLWFHLGVGMFNKQLQMFQNRIAHNYYDVIIYEYMPHLNNFYPLVLHDQLQKEYKLIDTFLAPRDPTNSSIEVYVKKR